MTRLRLRVNGEVKELDVPAHRTLAEVLRYDLGLTGTKIGCNEAECGACTVLVNGQAVDSCLYPALKAQGAEVLTIEGLAATWAGPTAEQRLHPLQQAFIEYGAVQCGFCTPGFLMQAKWLLDHNPEPDEAAIRQALKDTFCRCTGYRPIIDAIQAAAAEMRAAQRADDELEPLQGQPGPADASQAGERRTAPVLRVVGKPLPRPDAIAKVTGAARYTDDLAFPGMLHGRTLRANVPRGRLVRLAVSQARALPGVYAVLTAADVPGKKTHGLIYDDWPVMIGVGEEIHYVGDALAIVAAETRELAAQALQLIEVVIEPLPPVTSPQAALQPDAPVLHPEHPTGNLLKHIKVRRGDVEQGFAQAEVVVEGTYRTPCTEHAFLEPECSVAVPAGTPLADGSGVHEKLTVYVGSQIPYADRRQVAACLALPEEAVRIVGQPIGGGFGGKEDIAGQIHAALLAQATGRPVKMLYDRTESLLVHPKRHPTTIHVRLGARRDGRLIAAQVELWGDTGAYASLGDKVMTRATTHASGPYDIPHVKIDCYATYTNNPPAGAFRGFGVTQSCFAIESTMDMLAHELGLDPFILRRQNALRAGSVTATGQLLRESVGLLECLDRVQAEVERLSAEVEPPEPNKRRAWGIAAAFKNTGLGGGAPDQAAAEVELFTDGTAEVRTSSAELGQGLITVLAQITAEELGLAYEQVRVLLSDTERTPDGGPTTASRQTFVSGNAARLAARQMRELLSRVASERLDVSPDRVLFQEGRVWLASEGRNGSTLVATPYAMSDVARWASEEGRPLRLTYTYEAPPTQPLGSGGDMHFAFSFAVQAALVEVNTETGEVNVLRVVSATDVGKAVNPLALIGQIEGGIVMGLGNALTERFIVEQGKPWTRRLGQYKMPGIKLMPRMTTLIVEDPVSTGPYGAKGVGEIPSIPTSAAIANAIYNAVGVRVYALPVDQDELLRAMQAGERSVHKGWGDS